MNDSDWIVVPNWDKFQHYSDRDPPWIKLYTELNSRDDWLRLNLSTRGLLVTIWVEYARSVGVLSVYSLRRFCTNKAESRHLRDNLASLNHAGFIRLTASKPLAQRREEKKRTMRARTLARAREDGARDPHALAHLRDLTDTIWKGMQ